MKLLELYTSVQGEGPRTGIPIQFIRFAGCNMRCPGWPCDTPQAIFPELYTVAYQSVTPSQVVDLLPEYPNAVCITGGEPFMQKGIDDLIQMLSITRDVDIFSNGSFTYPSYLFDHDRVRIIMDWKLEGSGEATTRLMQRGENAQRLLRKDSIKFVVKDQDDLEEAFAWEQIFQEQNVKAERWVGAAWGHISDAQIVEFVVENRLNWRLNVQTHKHTWDPEALYT
jgi:7-carboxy-7-deazaguanine synthase